MGVIQLPWPPSSLSGHNNGHWRAKAGLVAKHRQWACDATKEAKPVLVPGDDDILIRIDFYPPDLRSDRVNFANRMKPYFDGIADALDVNDRRFLPSYHFHTPEKPGRIEVRI